MRYEAFWPFEKIIPLCFADDDGGGGDGGAGDDDGGGDDGGASAGAAAGGTAGGDDGGNDTTNAGKDAGQSADDGGNQDTTNAGKDSAQSADDGGAQAVDTTNAGKDSSQAADDGGTNQSLDKGDIGAAAGQTAETGPAAGFDSQGFNTNAFPDSGIALGVGPLGDAVAAAPLAPLDTNNTTGLQTTPEPAGVTPDVSKTLSNANVGDVGLGGVSPAVAANAAGLAGGISSAQDILSGNSPVAAALDAANNTQMAAAAAMNPQGGNNTTTVAKNPDGMTAVNTMLNPASVGDAGPFALPSDLNTTGLGPNVTGFNDPAFDATKLPAGFGGGNFGDTSNPVATTSITGGTTAGTQGLQMGGPNNDQTAVGVFGTGNLGVNPAVAGNDQLDPALLGKAPLSGSVFGVTGAPQDDPNLATLPAASTASSILAGSTGMQAALGGQNVQSVDMMPNLGGPSVASFQGTDAATSTTTPQASSLGGQAASTTDTSVSPVAGTGSPSPGPGPSTTADVSSALANAPATGSPSTSSSPTAADGSSGLTPQTLINPIPQNTGVLAPINDPNGAGGPVADGGPTAPFADGGSPSGYFNPDAGIFTSPARAGGFPPPPSASIPASDGATGPSANSAPLSSDGAPAGYYSPEAGIYDTLNNATDTGPP